MTPWRWVLGACLLVEVAWIVLPPPDPFVERWYSQGLYPAFAAVFVPIQNAAPVPITALLAALAILVAGYWAWRTARQLRDVGESQWRLLPRFCGFAAGSLIVFFLWVLVVWGAGYQRTPVAERWALDDRYPTPAESARLRAELLDVIHATVEAAPEATRADAVVAVADAMEATLGKRGDHAVRVPRQVRATPPGLFLTFSAAGMCVPGAVEPFADGAFDDVTFVQIAAHELAHVAGYNRESEATLVGYLAGLAADDPLARYAVALDIYTDLMRRLLDEETRLAAWEALPPRAQADVLTGHAIAARYQIQNRLFQQFGYHIYDGYLKTLGIEDGMADYATGLRLFTGAWRNGSATIIPRVAKADE